MKKLLLLTLFLVSLSFYSQNDNYYYYKGKKQNIIKSYQAVNIFVNSQFQENALNSLNIAPLELKLQNYDSSKNIGRKLHLTKLKHQ
jgi:hypothetical protein